MADPTRTQEVTIAAGASLSGSSAAVFDPDYRLGGLRLASTWDVAPITFDVSDDGVNFVPLKPDGTEYEVASVAGAVGISLEMKHFLPWDFVKVRSGTSGAAVNQVDATIITLVYVLF